ncbi:MAG: hypothetical protein ACRD2S_05825 [Terriglobales bacterium]
MDESPAKAGTAPRLAGISNEDFSFRPNDPLTLAGFNHFYNLEYDAAVRDFGEVLRRHPDDPFAINHFLTAVLFRELYRMGVLNTGEYANDSFIKAAHLPPNEHVQSEIKGLVKRALSTEQNRLAANPNDVAALYARGVTRAQFATYTALIEHAWFSALRNAVGARHDHERVLELEPGNTEAMLIVGAHNYVVGSLPWALRSAGTLAGLGGNKEKGLQMLRDCAAGRGETAVDAKILLTLFLRRERRYQEALPISRTLIAAYSRNILMALEEGNLLRADGKTDEAAEIDRNSGQAGKEGRYPGSHYEIAAFSLADLLRAKNDYAGSAAAYEDAGAVPHPDKDTLQRANLGAGEMYDLLKKRDLAVKKYQLVVAAGANSALADTANKYLKEPYHGQ